MTISYIVVSCNKIINNRNLFPVAGFLFGENFLVLFVVGIGLGPSPQFALYRSLMRKTANGCTNCTIFF